MSVPGRVLPAPRTVHVYEVTREFVVQVDGSVIAEAAMVTALEAAASGRAEAAPLCAIRFLALIPGEHGEPPAYLPAVLARDLGR